MICVKDSIFIILYSSDLPRTVIVFLPFLYKGCVFVTTMSMIRLRVLDLAFCILLDDALLICGINI